jgi:hypothetical protein
VSPTLIAMGRVPLVLRCGGLEISLRRPAAKPPFGKPAAWILNAAT